MMHPLFSSQRSASLAIIIFLATALSTPTQGHSLEALHNFQAAEQPTPRSWEPPSVASVLSSAVSSVSASAATASAVAAFSTPDWTPVIDQQAGSAITNAHPGKPPLTSAGSAQQAVEDAAEAVKQDQDRRSIRAEEELEPDSTFEALGLGNPHVNNLFMRAHHRKQVHRLSKLHKHRGARRQRTAGRSKAKGKAQGVKRNDTQVKAATSRVLPSGDFAAVDNPLQLLTSDGIVTWYAGNQLLNPACGGPNPTDSSLVGAISRYSSLGKCGDRIRITKDGNNVTVTIRDWCASCSDKHVDVTKGVFTQLAPLTVGVIQGVTMAKVDE